MDTKEYLIEHGLSASFVTKKLKWKLFTDRIEIPVFDIHGNLAYTRTRMLSGNQKFLSQQGAKLTIPYGIDSLLESDEVVFCEGEPDAAKLKQSGIPAVTFPSGVASVSSIAPEYLALFSNKTVYVTLDTDQAGQQAVPKLVKTLEEAGAFVKILSLPSSVKDVCEYFADHTIEDFYSLMQSSQSSEDITLSTFSEQYPILSTKEFINNEYPSPVWLVDSLIRMDGISLIVGESGTGKTIFTLSLAKAVSSGSLFLNKFETTPFRVLMLDKENTPADIQKLCLSMQIDSDSIFHLFTPEDYQLLTETGEPTPFSRYLTLFTKKNNIDVVILDSVIDFFIGDENSSVDVAKNINTWRSIFSSSTILGIHHEGKSSPHAKRSASDRIRGSSVWKSAAQSILSLSVINPLDPATLLVEHTKVRGGAKCQPFEIHMDIAKGQGSDNTATSVLGYSFVRELTEEKLATEKAEDAIITFLAKEPKRFFTYQDIVAAIENEEFSRRTIETSVRNMCDAKNLISRGKGGKNDPFRFQIANASSYKDVEEFIENYQ